MSKPTITAVEVIEPAGDHDLSNSHVSTVKVDLEWTLQADSKDVTVSARLSIPETRQWIEGLLATIESIEESYA